MVTSKSAIAFLAALWLPGTALSTSQEPRTFQQVARQRAAQAVIWGMPAVNYDRIYQAALGVGARANEIGPWFCPFDWKNQTLASNPRAIQRVPFMDTREGRPRGDGDPGRQAQ